MKYWNIKVCRFFQTPDPPGFIVQRNGYRVTPLLADPPIRCFFFNGIGFTLVNTWRVHRTTDKEYLFEYMEANSFDPYFQAAGTSGVPIPEHYFSDSHITLLGKATNY